MLAPEEENDTEVRREDQNNINVFARLNARLHEVRSERDGLRVRTVQLRRYLELFEFNIISCI